MNIFNDKTVVGLFDNGQDVEKAVAQLQKEGFGQQDTNEIQIIDKNRLTQEMPLNNLGRRIFAEPGKGLTTINPAAATKPGEQAGVATQAVERNAKEVLTDKGIGDKEASFFARYIARGNPVVIVETSKERAAGAFEIMQQANARTLEE